MVVHRLQITNRALVPDACIADSAPTELEGLVDPCDWRAFSADANKSIKEWKEVSSRTVRLGTPLLCLAVLSVLGAVFIYAYTTYFKTAVLALCVSIFLLIMESKLLCSGSKAERSARSDLKSVLDWHSEDKEGVSFELEKERAEGKWLPLYIYFIKVTAEIDQGFTVEQSESSSNVPVVGLDSTLSVEIDLERRSMKEPLLNPCADSKEND
eukprot:CAMPEP_0197459768 /NCGR_PEP_ID=MMETSP1175-20131217/52349_1 /TAXON_ID=1003142 /ORGANISM="Triceratium dubium, Strain CCMP147" /LENGTH=211 /DNA_ID=CAMNT_0042994735 /DNA_START=158 /DNA_END=793 /DNA_ORIENTATION=-